MLLFQHSNFSLCKTSFDPTGTPSNVEIKCWKIASKRQVIYFEQIFVAINNKKIFKIYRWKTKVEYEIRLSMEKKIYMRRVEYRLVLPGAKIIHDETLRKTAN